jgi:hypothetical protein
MYLASLLNNARLFQHVGGWKKTSSDEVQSDVDIFLFRASSAYSSFVRMQMFSGKCLEQFSKRKGDLSIKRNQIVFWSPTLVEFLNEFSPFLSSLRIMQNLLLPLTAKAVRTGKSIPLSLADCMRKLDGYGFGDEICGLVREYWRSSGLDVRGYRNIDQHYYAIVHHSFLQVFPEERVIVYLPDHPDEQSPKRVSFDKRRDALTFFDDAFLKLHNLVESIAKLLGFQPTPIDQTIRMAQLGDLAEGVSQTLALMIDDIERLTGAEFGQTEDRRVYVKLLKEL